MKTVFATLLLTSFLHAASFEAASIKLSPPSDSRSFDVNTDSGLLRMHNISLLRMIVFAYGVPESQVLDLPKSMDDPRYEIIAKATNPRAEDQELITLFQSLLAERFKLALHRESRMLSDYALTLVKGGIKATVSAKDSQSARMSVRRGSMVAKVCPLSRLTMKLSDILVVPVVDMTEEKRNFDFDLHWVPEDMQAQPDAPSGPTLFTALQEQLGLKLESRKVPVDVLVVDHAEPPSEN